MGNKTLTVGLIVLAIIVGLLCVGLGVVGSYQGAYNKLAVMQAGIPVARGNMTSGIRVLSTKIDAMDAIMNSTFSAEETVQIGYAEARSGYDRALEQYDQSGDPLPVIKAAADLGLVFNVQVENPPTTGFAELGASTQREVAEAFNQMLRLVLDYNGVVGEYNGYRKQLFMPQIAGNLGGYPASYDVYEVEGAGIPASYDEITE
ncbi:MAG TPA: hypothetical protein VJG85_02610 [Patescibacteria group bacterium]|nr:hypothetical protein [Patescibacteria group bacterium]